MYIILQHAKTVSRLDARIGTTIKCVVVFICGQTAAACKLLPFCAVYHGTGLYRIARVDRPDVHCLRVNVGLGRRFRHAVCGVSHPYLDCVVWCNVRGDVRGKVSC